MAPATSLFVENPTETPSQASKRISVKALVESPGLASIPSNYSYSSNPNESAASNPDEDTFPIIDFSLLTSADPHQRSKTILDLDKACREWGFFMVTS
ncbi:hypothetical protein RHSIM_RhsimUnG0105400 [Rhododendron simsii]|uniref:Non-haem dioxygenase N-terminal domain-containing protein n=1 Tax=Rhododendron simsii TaxID=118357 RepID=A0A834L4Z9_RHOSS|nr:hypothetical protein RHSIM_RhsimUnG0105400 [Rhododendron simsii]